MISNYLENEDITLLSKNDIVNNIWKFKTLLSIKLYYYYERKQNYFLMSSDGLGVLDFIFNFPFCVLYFDVHFICVEHCVAVSVSLNFYPPFVMLPFVYY